jgi:hypothetical protein
MRVLRLIQQGALVCCIAVAQGCEGDEGDTGSGGSAGGSGGATQATVASGASGPSGSTTGNTNATTGVGGGNTAGCFDYSTFTPTSVSFAGDVMPLFAAKCASCHNDTQASTYYGSQATVVYDKLLNGTPKQAPHLKFVAPNDPLRSYMLAKVEYANPGGTCAAVQCSEPGCELSAPPNNPLTETERGVLRSWIMNGAAND